VLEIGSKFGDRIFWKGELLQSRIHCLPRWKRFCSGTPLSLQNLALQRDALAEAGCGKIFTERLSGAVTDRPALREGPEFALSGDTLIFWKLVRLTHSMKQLIETIEELRRRGIDFRSLTEALDTTTGQGRLTIYMFGAWPFSLGGKWPKAQGKLSAPFRAMDCALVRLNALG
jgi:hypothetical protein